MRLSVGLHRIAWIVFCALAASQLHATNFELLQPRGVHALKDGQQHTTIPIVYEVSALDSNLAHTICFLLAVVNGRTFAESCTELSEHGASLHEIGLGNYRITAYLREYIGSESRILAESTRTSDFQVVHAADAVSPLPVLEVRLLEGPQNVDAASAQDKSWIAVADLTTGLAELSLFLVQQQTTSAVQAAQYSTCLWVHGTTTNAPKLAPTCLPAGQDTATLSGLSIGAYKLSTGLRAAGDDVVIPQSIRTWPFTVLQLADAYPVLSLAQSDIHRDESGGYRLEFGADGPAETATLSVSVTVQGLPGAVRQVMPCLSLYRPKSDNSRPYTDDNPHSRGGLVTRTCLAPDSSSFLVSSVGAGTYEAVLSLNHRPVLIDDVDAITAAVDAARNAARRGEVLVAIEVEKMTEFVPSYDWQPLRPWHTIPAGLETRLPIGSGDAGVGGAGSAGGVRKEARIPQPWQLQLSLPRPPCRGYFLRMDLQRHTALRVVRNAAAETCGVPSSCLRLLGDGSELDPSATVEDSNFFLLSHALEYDAACNT